MHKRAQLALKITTMGLNWSCLGNRQFTFERSMKLSLYRYQVNFGATSLLKLHICSYCAHDLRGERRGLALTIASPMEADSLRIKFQDYRAAFRDAYIDIH
jgi:hypothetical protein